MVSMAGRMREGRRVAPLYTAPKYSIATNGWFESALLLYMYGRNIPERRSGLEVRWRTRCPSILMARNIPRCRGSRVRPAHRSSPGLEG